MAEVAPVKIFYSYSHDDEALRKKLDNHLAFLKRDSVTVWYDREIIAGHVLDKAIQKELNDADIILLLVSSSFLSSFYCYEIEMKRAMERHEAGEAVVVPVLLSDCVWQRAPFAKLLMTPYDAKPVNNSKHWVTVDEAFTNTALSLEKTVKWVREQKEIRKTEEESIVQSITKPVNKLSEAPKPKPYFTGRESELEEFRKAIEAGVNLIAIDAPGGMGKTQFASRCIEKFIPADKVIWYDCATASQLDTLISEAGYSELLKGSNKTDREKFSAFKDKIQEKGLYVFLDNFQETNTTPVFKEFLLFIQEYLKSGSVIVLDRDDVRTFSLKPKRIHLEGFTTQRLDYAKALINHSYQGEIKVTDEQLDSLCGELQGYPLAIDFAIYLLSQGETPDNILTKIVNETDAYEISERLLNAIFERPDATEAERNFMRQFSAFTGYVPENTLVAIIPEDLVKAVSRKLQKKNLLSYSDGGYEIHPLVREFCYTELVDKKTIHTKIAEHYIQQRAEQLSPVLEEQIFYHLSKSEQWGRVEKEIEENGKKFILLGQIGIVKELLDKLQELKIERPIFHILYGDIAELQGQWRNAQNSYNKARLQETDKKVKAEGTVKYGEMLHRKGEVKEAMSFYEEAASYSKKYGFIKEEARALNDIGIVYKYWGEWEKCLEKFDAALKLREHVKDFEGVATTLSNIGCLYRDKGDLKDALKAFETSLSIYKKIDNKTGIARCLRLIGNIQHKRNNHRYSLKCFEESLEIERPIGCKLGIASSLSYIGRHYLYIQNIEKCLFYQKQALELYKEIGSKESIAYVLNELGNAYRDNGKIEKAIELFKEAISLAEEVGDIRETSVYYHNLALTYAHEKIRHWEASLLCFFKSLGTSIKLGAKSDLITTQQCINSVRTEMGLPKFKVEIARAYEALEYDLQKYISLQELLKEPVVRSATKAGRNDPCPCGSGKKYKKCHGKEE